MSAKRPPLTDFQKWRDRLRRSYTKANHKRPKDKTTTFRKRPMNALKREAYAYYRELAHAGQLAKLKAYVRERDGSRWDGHGDEGAQWICRLFASTEQDRNTTKTRSRLAIEMELAFVNDIRPELYLGFLYEAGPYELIEAKMRKASKVCGWADAYRSSKSHLIGRNP